jgi:hypothetical protein
MKMNTNWRLRLLVTSPDIAIGIAYLFLGVVENRAYLIIGVAHLISVVVHGGSDWTGGHA